jgi:hypothetical protein
MLLRVTLYCDILIKKISILKPIKTRSEYAHQAILFDDPNDNFLFNKNNGAHTICIPNYVIRLHRMHIFIEHPRGVH